MRIEPGLIPVALARAKLVSPCEELKGEFEEAIYKDLAEPDPTFSWNKFLSRFIP